jgi:hypothetical protein
MPKVISSEQAAEENEGKLREMSENRMSRLDEALRTEEIDFDMEKNNEDPIKQEHAYIDHCRTDLASILAEAGREEAKAKAREFGKP